MEEENKRSNRGSIDSRTYVTSDNVRFLIVRCWSCDDRRIVQNGSLSSLEWLTWAFARWFSAMDFTNFTSELFRIMFHFMNETVCHLAAYYYVYHCSKTSLDKNIGKELIEDGYVKMSQILAILMVVLCGPISFILLLFHCTLIKSLHLPIYFFIIYRANFNKQFRYRCIHDTPQI